MYFIKLSRIGSGLKKKYFIRLSGIGSRLNSDQYLQLVITDTTYKLDSIK